MKAALCAVAALLLLHVLSPTACAESVPLTPIGIDLRLLDVNALSDFGSTFDAELELSYLYSDPNATSPDDARMNLVVYGNVVKREVVWSPTVIIRGDVVRVTQRERSRFAFSFDFEAFPFDSQKPYIIVEPVSAGSEHLVLVSTQEEDSLLDKKDVFHLEGWGDYRSATIEPHVRASGRGGRVDGLEFSFKISRDYVSFVTQNIIPSVAFVCIAWAGFFIDFNALMPRLMPILFATVALTGANVSTSRFIPRADQVTFFEIFALVSTLMTALVLLELIIVHNFARHGYREYAKLVDMASRFLFPLSYAGVFFFMVLLLAVDEPTWSAVLFLVLAILVVLAAFIVFLVWRIWKIAHRKKTKDGE